MNNHGLMIGNPSYSMTSAWGSYQWVGALSQGKHLKVSLS